MSAYIPYVFVFLTVVCSITLLVLSIVGLPSIGKPENECAEDLHCPVCGYYCTGKGGLGCIDKPTIVRDYGDLK